MYYVTKKTFFDIDILCSLVLECLGIKLTLEAICHWIVEKVWKSVMKHHYGSKRPDCLGCKEILSVVLNFSLLYPECYVATEVVWLLDYSWGIGFQLINIDEGQVENFIPSKFDVLIPSIYIQNFYSVPILFWFTSTRLGYPSTEIWHLPRLFYKTLSWYFSTYSLVRNTCYMFRRVMVAMFFDEVNYLPWSFYTTGK